MGSAFGDFITVEPRAGAWEHADKIQEYMMESLASDVGFRLRSRIDTGINLGNHRSQNTLTVRASSGRLIIRDNVDKDKEDAENTTIDDLFRASNASPYAEGNKLIFRQITEENLAKKNESAVKASFEEAVHLNLGKHVEDAVKKVKSENPGTL